MAEYQPKGIDDLPWDIGQSETKFAIVPASAIGSETFEHPVCLVSPVDKVDARDVRRAYYIKKAANEYPNHINLLRVLCAKLWHLQKHDDGSCTIRCEVCGQLLTFTDAQEAMEATEYPFCPMRHDENCPVGRGIDAVLRAAEREGE